jgi:hypothetical protein
MLREEYIWSEAGNRLLRIFGPKREEVVEDWSRIHSEELCNL